MFILKNITFFLAGVFLIIWGFRVNMDREGNAAAIKEENTVSEEEQVQKEVLSSPSFSQAPAKIRSPKKAAAKKRRAGKTVLEKKMPEKASGSQ